MASGRRGSDIVPKMWERPFWEGVWHLLDPWDSVRLRTASTHWNVHGKCGPHGELTVFLIQTESVASNEVLPNPFVSAKTLKAWALIGLHLLAAEGEVGSSGSQSPDLGDMWRYGCPKSLNWDRSCSASDASCGENYEHNNECRAIEVIGQGWSS